MKNNEINKNNNNNEFTFNNNYKLNDDKNLINLNNNNNININNSKDIDFIYQGIIRESNLSANSVSDYYQYDYKYNNKVKYVGSNIIYKDFYYKEIKYGSSESSSSRSSLDSQISNKSEKDEVNIISKKNYPEDNRKKKIEPEDEFSKYIFKQINNIRKNPKSFINKIESSIKNIKMDKRNNCIYKGKQNASLNNGVYAFENTIKHLKILRGMEELQYCPKMNIRLPVNEEEINNKTYQHNMVQNLLKNKINIHSFWREVIRDPEECLLLMIVDDCGMNCGFKRKDLLNRNMKYIGINSTKIGKYFSCYITLSEK